MAGIKSTNKITLNIINKDKLIQWLSQYSSIDLNLPIEICVDTNELKSKLANAEHIVIRYSTIKLTEIFKSEDIDTLKSTITSDLRWGIYGVDKLIKVLKAFDSNEIKATLFVNTSDGQGYYSIDKVTFSEDKLKFDVYSINFSLLTYLEDAKYKIISNVSDAILTFDLNLPNLIKIASLSALDMEEEIAFKSKGKKVFAQCKSFDYELCTIPTDIDTKISVKKKYFSLVDKLAWKVYVLDSNQIVLVSQSADTTCELIIGGVDE